MHLKLLQLMMINMSINTLIHSLYMLIHLQKEDLCHLNGKVWRLIRFLKEFWKVESKFKMIKKNKSNNNFMMFGEQVCKISFQVPSLLQLLKWSYQLIMKVIIHQQNICLMKNKDKSGKRWMSKIELLISFLNNLVKSDIFLFTKNLLMKDSKDV
jgi:hypothetical protein